jgi:hypothetical protein
MKLVEYTTKNLYGEFKPEEVCFVVDLDYEYISELSYITDDMWDAVDEAKETNSKIFVFTKKFTKDCMDTERLFQDMIENLEEEGLDRNYVLYHMEENGKKEFAEMIEKWFRKNIDQTYWITDRLLGTLKTGD